MDPLAASPSSPTTSLVSKARTVFHSAATKAEKVFTDIRFDLRSDRDRVDGQSQKSRERSTEEMQVGSEVPEKAMEEYQQEFKHSKWKHIGRTKKQDWQQSLKNLRIGKKDADMEKFDNLPALVAEESMDQKECENLVAKETSAIGKSDLTALSTPPGTNIIPPASVLKNLAAAIEKGRTFTSVKDVLMPDNNLPLMKEKAGLSFSVMKSLVLREKEERLKIQSCGGADISSAIWHLFNSEEFPVERKDGSRYNMSPVTYIRGAPPESFLVKVSEITGSFKSLHKMISFWQDIVAELRRRWSECEPIPYMPLDENPDLNSCGLHQQMQVINCCISRKLRRTMAMASLDSLASTSSPDGSADSLKLSASSTIYARTRTGDHVLRLGASRPYQNLTLLETGEPVYSPVTQEGPVLTEELIKETEEFVLRTGSIGAGCSQLISDMQAFKAANPGCILEDFVRWYSPPDWTEENLDCEDDTSLGKGCLSGRMQKEGNLWREFWETAKAVPAAKQAPLFDEDLAVEGIFTYMEDISPSDLLEQQFLSLLYTGFVLAESAVSDGNLMKLYNDCKEHAIATCQGGLSSGSISELCKVYETIETNLAQPEEVLCASEVGISSEPRNMLKKLALPFVSKERRLPKLSDQKTDEKNIRAFSNLFDGKASLFLKKQPHPNLSAATKSGLDESDWTVV